MRWDHLPEGYQGNRQGSSGRGCGGAQPRKDCCRVQSAIIVYVLWYDMRVQRRITMTTHSTQLTQRPAWQALAAHYEQIRDVHLRTLFAADPQRGERLAFEAAGLYFDYSKNRVTDETMRLLVQLAEACGLREKTAAMFSGEKINITAKRAVLHVALRAPRDQSIVVDGQNVVPEVHTVLEKMASFSERVRSGDWLGHTGK